MSSSTSRKLPAEVLMHPDVTALIARGRAAGQVDADTVCAASEAATVSPQHLKGLLKLLSKEGITVAVPAEESAVRKKVAAAAPSRTSVKASTSRKAKRPAAEKPASSEVPAKKAPARKAAAQKAPETAATVDTNGVVPAAAVGPDGKKLLPDIPDETFEKDLKEDPTLKE
ncbi:MAG: RNA polymerase sigma factor, partial [Actinomycetota bacterium]|nr:RNA polymerase sigma factor [Actinomycetota bacterium]